MEEDDVWREFDYDRVRCQECGQEYDGVLDEQECPHKEKPSRYGDDNK